MEHDQEASAYELMLELDRLEELREDLLERGLRTVEDLERRIDELTRRLDELEDGSDSKLDGA